MTAASNLTIKAVGAVVLVTHDYGSSLVGRCSLDAPVSVALGTWASRKTRTSFWYVSACFACYHVVLYLLICSLNLLLADLSMALVIV